MTNKQVVIIGGGVAGLTVALELAHQHIESYVLEKSTVIGGHAVQYACKAADACVKCGACMAEEKLKAAQHHALIHLLTGVEIEDVCQKVRFNIRIRQNNTSFLDLPADSVVLATGFKAYEPYDKPYGWGVFKNVITNLELERILKAHGVVKRPSDGNLPKSMAFIQCVGSRDAKLKHLWCSKICCASALQTAQALNKKQPQTQITIFYIDIQTIGRNFQPFYTECQHSIRMIRSIPADIYPADADSLKVISYDAQTQESQEQVFELVVLSVAMTPNDENKSLFQKLGVETDDAGFITGSQNAHGIFFTGSVSGPMSIAETIRHSCQTAGAIRQYLGVNHDR